jgi:hypothetical protein
LNRLPGEGTKENVLHFRYPANREKAYVTSIDPHFIHYLSVSGHFNLMHCFHLISSVFILFHLNTADATSRMRAIAADCAYSQSYLRRSPPKTAQFRSISARRTRLHTAFTRVAATFRLFMQLHPIALDSCAPGDRAALRPSPFYNILRAWTSRIIKSA